MAPGLQAPFRTAVNGTSRIISGIFIVYSGFSWYPGPQFEANSTARIGRWLNYATHLNVGSINYYGECPMSAKEKVERHDCHVFLEEWLIRQQRELSAVNYSPVEVHRNRTYTLVTAIFSAIASLDLFPNTSYEKWLEPIESNSWQGPIRDWYAVGQDVQKSILKCAYEELSVKPSEQSDRSKTFAATR